MAILEQCNQCRAYNPKVGFCNQNWELPKFDGESCKNYNDKNANNEENAKIAEPFSEPENEVLSHVIKKNIDADTEIDMNGQHSMENTPDRLRSISELKDAALNELRGKWKPAFFFTLVSILLIAVWVISYSLCGLNAHTPVRIILLCLLLYGGGLFFVSVLYYGIYNAFIEAERRSEAVNINRLFMGFDSIATYIRVIWQVIVVFWFLFWWSMLFMLPFFILAVIIQSHVTELLMLFTIPTLVKSYSYSMVPYICYDYPEMSANEAIEYSKRIMSGHKWKLFVLHLSFIGWFILGILTFSIGNLWIIPYFNATQAQFYEDIKGDGISL